jgi:hypothetical protein
MEAIDHTLTNLAWFVGLTLVGWTLAITLLMPRFGTSWSAILSDIYRYRWRYRDVRNVYCDIGMRDPGMSNHTSLVFTEEPGLDVNRLCVSMGRTLFDYVLTKEQVFYDVSFTVQRWVPRTCSLCPRDRDAFIFTVTPFGTQCVFEECRHVNILSFVLTRCLLLMSVSGEALPREVCLHTAYFLARDCFATTTGWTLFVDHQLCSTKERLYRAIERQETERLS